MKKFLCLAFLCVSLAFGDAIIFDLEMNKVSYAEAVKKFPKAKKFKDAKKLVIPKEDTPIKNLLSEDPVFGFDDEDKLVTVSLRFKNEKGMYDSVKNSLSQTYTPVNSKDFVVPSDMMALFADINTGILLTNANKERPTIALTFISEIIKVKDKKEKK